MFSNSSELESHSPVENASSFYRYTAIRMIVHTRDVDTPKFWEVRSLHEQKETQEIDCSGLPYPRIYATGPYDRL